MISLSKSGSTVTFTFDENSGYLQNGTIDVPVNSLSLITDESGMLTFRKSASHDIFISARYEEFGMTKAELEAWYKENMVSSGGGGGGTGGTTPEEVQQMIDESISGKADSSAVTQEISAAVSGKIDSSSAVTNVKVLTASQQNELQLVQSKGGETGTTYAGTVYRIGSGLTWDYQTKNIEVDSSTIALKSELSGKADTFSVGSSLTLSGGILDTSYRGYTNFYQEYETIDPFMLLAGFDCDDTTIGNADFSINDGEYYFSFEFNSETHEFSTEDEGWENYLQISWNDNLKAFSITPLDGTVMANDGGCVRFFDEYELHYGGTTTDALDGAFGEIARIDESFSGKQDTLVSGTNIKTINNESILGSGNIVIQGGGGNPTVELTQAEYDALVTAGTVSADTYYIITDAQSVDISNYWTSAQTDSAINQAVSGKQDTLSAGTGISISGNVISATGGGGGVTSGEVQTMIDNSISGKVDTSAITTSITSASTDSQVATAKAVYDKLGGISIVKLTESQYTALVTKDSNTLYVVMPDPSN